MLVMFTLHVDTAVSGTTRGTRPSTVKSYGRITSVQGSDDCMVIILLTPAGQYVENTECCQI